MASAELRLLCLNFFAERGHAVVASSPTAVANSNTQAGDLTLPRAGGNAPAKLDAALREVPEWVRQRLA
ncbi:MAG: hypothetical protein NTX45_21110 [Proteobacteria bacterium]|nr:hypothetical protein [Pseudomonadota bacterium]